MTNHDVEGSWPKSFGFGRTATMQQIDSIDFDVRPDGLGLPVGSGSFVEGRSLFESKCSRCHGANGYDGPYGSLVTNPADTASTVKTIGNYWPYATTVFDYIYRAMPYDRPGSLTTDEVYDITVFLLSKNGLMDSTTTINNKTLPLIEMPARKLYIEDDRTGGPVVR